MIVITGTKRSGTSMWMQVLFGAGFPVIGERFPGRWRETLVAANPDGFFKSRLRCGLLSATETDPLTGRPMDRDSYRSHAVKISVPGLVRTHRRHLWRVLGTVRDFREYEQSRRRLWRQLEDQARRQQKPDAEPPARIEPLYEWWTSTMCCWSTRYAGVMASSCVPTTACSRIQSALFVKR
jgi:hypothetical protein